MATEKIVPKIDLANLHEQAPVSEKKQEVRGFENQLEAKLKSSNNLEKTELDNKLEASPVSTKSKIKVKSVTEQRAIAVDNILSEGLHEVFLNMDVAHQKEFKRVGDETTLEITTLLDKAKVRVEKIINLIKKWLKIIPGVNKFFLEQEAKIKADKIMRIKDNY